MNKLTEQQVATNKDASRKLTGVKRRAFQAQVVVDYVEGNPRDRRNFRQRPARKRSFRWAAGFLANIH